MNELEWRSNRDSRTIRYAGRRLDPNRWINLVGDARYLETYAGQVASITLVNLLSRIDFARALVADTKWAQLGPPRNRWDGSE